MSCATLNPSHKILPFFFFLQPLHTPRPISELLDTFNDDGAQHQNVILGDAYTDEQAGTGCEDTFTEHRCYSASML